MNSLRAPSAPKPLSLHKFYDAFRVFKNQQIGCCSGRLNVVLKGKHNTDIIEIT